MTVQPALARLERGYRRMWAWCVAKAQGARPYRFDGEERIHADQLRETQVALAMMVGADQGDPDQQRMATDFEGGAEARLRVLLDLPILTTDQKRERDAIQFALQARRQSFDAPRLVQRTDGGWRPQRLMGSLRAMAGGWQVWAIAGAITLSGWGVAAVQAQLKERVEDQRDEARARADRMEASRNSYAQALGQQREAHARDVAAVLETTAHTVEQLQRQRQRERAREARERSRNEDLANGNVNFGERLRELAEPAAGGLPAASAPEAGGGAAGGVPTPAGRHSDADRTN